MFDRCTDRLKRGITTIGRVDDGDMNMWNAWTFESLFDTLLAVLLGIVVFAVSEDDKFGLVLAVLCVTRSRFEDVPNCVP